MVMAQRWYLVCVVHVKPEDDNTWSLGCTFARDVTAKELGTVWYRPRGLEHRRTTQSGSFSV